MEVEDKRKHIVIVDDNPVNLDLAECVLREHYKLTKLISGEQLMKFLTRITPQMILLDIQMPGMDGYETIAAIKKNPAWRNIPVIFITGQQDIFSEREGFRLGAKDFIIKPFDHEVMLARIQSQMELYQYRMDLEAIVCEKTKEIGDLQHIITVGWAEAIESRDGTTGSHVRNTTRYFEVFLKILADIPAYSEVFSLQTMDSLLRASSLHDIGKIGISDNVLKKPGPLSNEEFKNMQTHSKAGADIIQKIIDNTHPDEVLKYAWDMAMYHHERWDGTGYPCGLAGEKIPLYVQVLSIVDVFDALTSVRPYKHAFSYEEALEIMRKERGKFFSPDLFDIFVENGELMHVVLRDKQ